MENAYVDIPISNYLYQGLQMGMNAWDLINFITGGYSLSLSACFLVDG
jgi:hypothetical protein